MAAARDWSSLHQDILSQIFLLLACIADRARAAAVNGHWRRVALENPPFLPWLLMPSTARTACYRIFGGFNDPRPSLSGEGRGARFCGSFSGGWFVVSLDHWRGHALLNIRSGERVPLPDRVRVRIPYNSSLVRCPMMIRAAAMSAAPSSAACVVAAMTSSQTNMAFWRPGMDCWLSAPVGMEPTGPCNAQDLTYHDGWFCVVTSTEELFRYKPQIAPAAAGAGDDGASSLTIAQEISYPRTAPVAHGGKVFRYLLPSASGADLLMVRRYVSPARGGTWRFEVFRLQKQEDGRPASWRFYPMGGQVLFVGRACSKAFDMGHAGNRGGYIYFLDDVYHGVPHSFLLQKEYPCDDAGRWGYATPDVINNKTNRCLPWAPPSDSSPCIWYLH